jgi:hypothetical protein
MPTALSLSNIVPALGSYFDHCSFFRKIYRACTLKNLSVISTDYHCIHSQQGSSLVSQWEASILKWPNMACPTAKEAPNGCKLLQCTIANGGLVQPANERPVCCAGGMWITHAVGRVGSLAYLALACQMQWTGEVSIIITLD